MQDTVIVLRNLLYASKNARCTVRFFVRVSFVSNDDADSKDQGDTMAEPTCCYFLT